MEIFNPSDLQHLGLKAGVCNCFDMCTCSIQASYAETTIRTLEKYKHDGAIKILLCMFEHRGYSNIDSRDGVSLGPDYLFIWPMS